MSADGDVAEADQRDPEGCVAHGCDPNMRYCALLDRSSGPAPAAPAPRRERAAGALRLVAPGLALASAGALAGFLVHALVPGVPVVLVALVLGLLVANTVGAPASPPAPGSRSRRGRSSASASSCSASSSCSRTCSRSAGAACSSSSPSSSRPSSERCWAGKRLGVSDGLSLLVATGFSICGVSAIAAARGVSDADEEEVTYAIALVTLCGSLAIVLLPALNRLLGMSDHDYGAWVGASVHDIAQVVATSSAVGGVAVATAVVVKLTRVLLLGPLVAWIAWRQGRSARRLAAGGSCRRSCSRSSPPRRCEARASCPSGLLPVLADAKTVLLAVALFAVGARVELRRLFAVGGRPLVLGLSSWVIVALVAYVGVTVVWS